MALNKDGLEPGQPVDFETMIRVNRQREAKKHESSAAAKPAKRGRKARKDVRADDEQSIQNSPDAAGAQEA